MTQLLDLRRMVAIKFFLRLTGSLSISLLTGAAVLTAQVDGRLPIRTNAEMIGLRDEKTFTDAEIADAFSFVLPAEEARQVAKELNLLPDLKGFESATPDELLSAPVKSPRSYDGDILDLLSLVSESCAERAWRLLGLPSASGRERRREFVKRIGPILLRQPKVRLTR